ncbi:MAG: glycogen debranching protein [Nocardioidaceae bacterium]
MRRSALVAAAVSLLLPLSVLTVAAPATGAAPSPSKPAGSGDPEAPAYRSPELSTTTRLADRRSLVVGDRFYAMGAEDGTYPATGWHIRGEMGGFWTPPIKVLDGLWFKVGDSWLGAQKYTSGWGYQRMDLGTHDGVRITRTDFAPDGVRAGLVGLRLDTKTATTLHLAVDAHSELMKVYPWGGTTPSQSDYNLPDTGSVSGNSLLFREDGTPPVPNAEAHHYAALVGSDLTPTGTSLGPDHRGPQDPANVCTTSGGDSAGNPCDDTAFGKGTGGQLRYTVDVPAGGRTVWFSVAGSDDGVDAAQAAQSAALQDPTALLQATVAHRRTVEEQTQVSLPGDPLLQQGVQWSKQNLAESVQEARNLQVRVSHEGKEYPPSAGTVAKARWIGAGFPDYPWLFATDGEYTGFAAVASGQFQAIEDHLRALRDVSLIANGDSGKVVHEVTSDGQVYYGANSDAGNTDETAKFPSIVALVWRWTGDNAFRDSMYDFAKQNLHYVYDHLDTDGDGWPEGSGNVERPGMGAEKLDVAVYTIRGLRDLADMAASKGDTTTRDWASSKAADLEKRFEKTWWYGPQAQQYADSLDNPGNSQVFQRHWIGLTPVEAELHRPGQVDGPLASLDHARTAVAQREKPCYTGQYGLYHTGTGATSDAKGNPGPTCDSTTSTAPSDREVFTLTTSIMAVAEAALGRMGDGQMARYADDNATVQLDPSVWELPGAMPEISPSPDFGANIDKLFTERSMALQAWGTYGVLWPVVHYVLGVAPDLGNNRVQVVPQVPDGQHQVAGTDIRLGDGSIDVHGSRSTDQVATSVKQTGTWALTVGALLPAGAHVASVTVDGSNAAYRVIQTARGSEVVADGGSAPGTTALVVRLR